MSDEALAVDDPAPGPGPAPAPRKGRAARAFGIFAAVLVLLALLSCAAAWLFFFRTAGIPAGRTVEVEIPQGRGHAPHREASRQRGRRSPTRTCSGSARAWTAPTARLKAGTYEFVTGMDYETVILRLEEGPPMMYVSRHHPRGLHDLPDRRARAGQDRHPGRGVQARRHQGRDRVPGQARVPEVQPDLHAGGLPLPEDVQGPPGRQGGRRRSGMMLDQFEKETAGDRHELRLLQEPDAARRRHHRVDDRARDAAVPGAHARGLGHLQPSRTRACGSRSTRPCSTCSATSRACSTATCEVESPYNTYLHKGLPPGPIASPGLASLEAAAHPADTAYIYYVLTGKNGSHTFASNQADFLRAKQHARGGLK